MSVDELKPKCCQWYMKDFYKKYCHKNASVEEEGKHYCKVHAPSLVQARYDKRYAGWQKQWADKDAARKQERLERLIGQEVLRQQAVFDGGGVREVDKGIWYVFKAIIARATAEVAK